jgi:O-antigen/teichoic acid export membrane protein
MTVEGAHEESALTALTHRTARFGLILILPSVALCILAAPELLGLLGRQYAAQGTVLLRLLALGVLPRSITLLQLGVARVQRNTRRIATVQGVTCLLVLGLCWIGLDRFGLAGVGWGYLLAQITVALVLTPSTIALLRRPAAAAAG